MNFSKTGNDFALHNVADYTPFFLVKKSVAKAAIVPSIKAVK